MAQRTVDYTTDAERQTALAGARAGERVVHDDLLADGSRRLTFDDAADGAKDLTRIKALEDKLSKAQTLTTAELSELLKLERGL